MEVDRVTVIAKERAGGRRRCGVNALRALSLALVAVLGCEERPRPDATGGPIDYIARTPVRLSMEALHRAGGVPPGWSLSVPRGDVAAGRAVFEVQGCPSCHEVAGEAFAVAERRPGPDLTGMASHHPQAYFVEAILNPNAVIVEGPGYAGADGLSIMPAYPDLTAAELSHLIAYLESLTGEASGGHAACEGEGPSFDGEADRLPPARETGMDGGARHGDSALADAGAFLAVTYEIRAGGVEGLRQWFAAEGLRSFDGLIAIESYVDRTRRGGDVVTVFAFRDMTRLLAFLDETREGGAMAAFDAHARAVDRRIFDTRPLYQAAGFPAR